jgi:hypothetical protein
VSEVVHQNYEDEKNASAFFEVTAQVLVCGQVVVGGSNREHVPVTDEGNT